MASDQPIGVTIAAGAIAGASEVLVMYPLDTLKTRAQQSEGAVGSMRGAVVKMWQEEGLRRFYRGIAAPLMQEPIKRSIKFFT